MPYKPLKNYLRSARRRAGLSQSEVARLLGVRSAAKVCRHESGSRHPSLYAALAYEVIFRVPPSQMLAGTYAGIRKKTIQRATRLLTTFKKRPGKASGRKVEFLRSLIQKQPGTIRIS